MKKQLSTAFLAITFSLFTFNSFAQNVSISSTGTPPDASAGLDVNFLNRGLLIPRVALTGTNDVATIATATTSLLVYNTATAGVAPNNVLPGFYYWNGTKWIAFGGTGGTDWSLTGNAGTTVGTNFLGTTDAQDLAIYTNNAERIRVNLGGNVGIGVALPAFNLDVSSDINTAGNYNQFSNVILTTKPNNSALNLNNTAVGRNALALNTTGIQSVAAGFNALAANTIGNNNTAVGFSALKFNTTGGNNTAVGADALFVNTTGGGNTAVGASALGANIWGSSNTAVGANALFVNTTGGRNTAVGRSALAANIWGNSNTAVGADVLFVNTTGFGNTAIGESALAFNTVGNSNTAVGTSALIVNTTGNNNTAVGRTALQFNTTGLQNTAVGSAALLSNTTGFQNTAVGSAALLSNTTGGRNTAVGNGADVSSGILTNATAIGASAVTNASNKIRIGNASVTVIEGQVAYTFPSDGRFKKNISDDEVAGLDFINRLRPVVYNFDTKKFEEFLTQNMPDSTRKEHFLNVDFESATAVRQTGFIAQEVEQAMKNADYNFNGLHHPQNENDNYSLSYSLFVVPLVKAVQEQQKIIERLKAENTAILNEMNNLKATTEARLKLVEEYLKTANR